MQQKTYNHTLADDSDNYDIKYIERAIGLSQIAFENGCDPFGAVIVRRIESEDKKNITFEIVGEDYNRIAKECDPSYMVKWLQFAMLVRI